VTQVPRPASLFVPIVVARPNAWVSLSNPPRRNPASAWVKCFMEPTRMPVIGEKSITKPPSLRDLPA
jgi:hypothetical protein